MADVEFRVSPIREPTPTFIKPLDPGSHRWSRASHESAAPSMRSWVVMNQQDSPLPPRAEPIPVPEPVPALSPPPPPAPRPLPEPPRRTSRLDESGAEHMAVELPPGEVSGYEWTTGRVAKAREAHLRKEKSFVGGFVSGLRRLPRALVRTRRPRQGTTHMEEGVATAAEGTGMTGSTLSRYVSDPTTSVVPGASVGFVQGSPGGGLTIGEAAPRESWDGGNGRRPRPRHPSFMIEPPEEDVQQEIASPRRAMRDVQEEEEGDRGGPSVLEFPQTPLENPYDRETSLAHDQETPAAAAALPYLSSADDHLAVPAPGTAEGGIDSDEPVSVQVHPLPTEDYRRMSAADAAQQGDSRRTTITSASFSSDSPSFSSEIGGMHRFLNALHILPWIATERVTADYRPKIKSKELVSWYRPEGESAAAAGTRTLDDRASPASATPTSRARSPPRHRTHRRAASQPLPRALPDPPPPAPASPPPAAYGYPVAYSYYPAFSPSAPSPSPPLSSSPPPTRRRAHSPRAHAHAHRHHHRRSATYHASPLPPQQQQQQQVPMPVPWMSPPLLPAPPAPVYILQASPTPTASTSASSPPSPPTASPSAQGTPDSTHAAPSSGLGSPPPPPHAHAHTHTHSHSHSSPALGSASPPGDGMGMGVGMKPILVAPVYMQMQLVPGPGTQGNGQHQHQLAFISGPGPGTGYPYGYYGSPTTMPAPAQSVRG